MIVSNSSLLWVQIQVAPWAQWTLGSYGPGYNQPEGPLFHKNPLESFFFWTQIQIGTWAQWALDSDGPGCNKPDPFSYKPTKIILLWAQIQVSQWAQWAFFIQTYQNIFLIGPEFRQVHGPKGPQISTALVITNQTHFFF